MEFRRAFRDPGQKRRQTRMLAQRLNRVIVAGKLGFRERGVDFVVANLVEKHRRTTLAASKFRDEMMQALRRLRRDRAAAEGTDGNTHG